MTVLRAQEGRQQKLGVLSSADNDILYVSTERDNELVVVELVTDEIVKKYPVGDTPNEIEITSYDRSTPVAADE